ncbi:hypothetical protein TRFO_04183 [Tritrichomonas foetus]|uniref:Uncharacterized protein n=1 Tax=Tritrichomonas foetus TaxID=1144522 RepID=A0A1J4KLK2_9EUKA|nr:hypothetical protein TRFO_04183 [Tritrichomonas foetus]|eukprot:OHT10676.1 hypothetical protein TRFO_04183 [Tritrichomonas foetus]
MVMILIEISIKFYFIIILVLNMFVFWLLWIQILSQEETFYEEDVYTKEYRTTEKELTIRCLHKTTLVILNKDGFTAAAYNNDDSPIGDLSEENRVVYFGLNGGYLTVKSNSNDDSYEIMVNAFKMKFLTDCPSLFLSTSPFEKWNVINIDNKRTYSYVNITTVGGDYDTYQHCFWQMPHDYSYTHTFYVQAEPNSHLYSGNKDSVVGNGQQNVNGVSYIWKYLSRNKKIEYSGKVPNFFTVYPSVSVELSEDFMKKYETEYRLSFIPGNISRIVKKGEDKVLDEQNTASIHGLYGFHELDFGISNYWSIACRFPTSGSVSNYYFVINNDVENSIRIENDFANDSYAFHFSTQASSLLTNNNYLSMTLSPEAKSSKVKIGLFYFPGTRIIAKSEPGEYILSQKDFTGSTSFIYVSPKIRNITIETTDENAKSYVQGYYFNTDRTIEFNSPTTTDKLNTINFLGYTTSQDIKIIIEDYDNENQQNLIKSDNLRENIDIEYIQGNDKVAYVSQTYGVHVVQAQSLDEESLSYCDSFSYSKVYSITYYEPDDGIIAEMHAGDDIIGTFSRENPVFYTGEAKLDFYIVFVKNKRSLVVSHTRFYSNGIGSKTDVAGIISTQPSTFFTGIYNNYEIDMKNYSLVGDQRVNALIILNQPYRVYYKSLGSKVNGKETNGKPVIEKYSEPQFFYSGYINLQYSGYFEFRIKVDNETEYNMIPFKAVISSKDVDKYKFLKNEESEAYFNHDDIYIFDPPTQSATETPSLSPTKSPFISSDDSFPENSMTIQDYSSIENEFEGDNSVTHPNLKTPTQKPTIPTQTSTTPSQTEAINIPSTPDQNGEMNIDGMGDFSLDISTLGTIVIHCGKFTTYLFHDLRNFVVEVRNEGKIVAKIDGSFDVPIIDFGNIEGDLIITQISSSKTLLEDNVLRFSTIKNDQKCQKTYIITDPTQVVSFNTQDKPTYLLDKDQTYCLWMTMENKANFTYFNERKSNGDLKIFSPSGDDQWKEIPVTGEQETANGKLYSGWIDKYNSLFFMMSTGSDRYSLQVSTVAEKGHVTLNHEFERDENAINVGGAPVEAKPDSPNNLPIILGVVFGVVALVIIIVVIIVVVKRKRQEKSSASSNNSSDTSVSEVI